MLAASADALQRTGAEPKLAAGIRGGGREERGEEAARKWAGRAVEGVRMQLTPGGGLLNDGG